MDEQWSDKVVDIVLLIAVIVVVILKLCNVIKISWLWLLSPIWVCLIVGTAVMFILLIVYLITAIFIDKENKNERN